jgi:hypothetical protein
MLPLHLERDSDDGEACMFRDDKGHPVRIDKPDRHSEARREALIDYYESQYVRVSN